MIKVIATVIALLMLMSSYTFGFQADQKITKDTNKYIPRIKITSCGDSYANLVHLSEDGFGGGTFGVLKRLKPYQEDPLFGDVVYSLELVKNAGTLKKEVGLYKQRYFYVVNHPIYNHQHCNQKESFSFNGKTLLENINDSENILTSYLSNAPKDLLDEYERLDNLPVFSDAELKKYEIFLSDFINPVSEAIESISHHNREPDYGNYKDFNEEAEMEVIFERKSHLYERSNRDYFNAFYQWMSDPITQAKYEGSCIQFAKIRSDKCYGIKRIIKQYIEWYNMMTGEDASHFKDIKSFKDTLALRKKKKQQLLTKMNEANEMNSLKMRNDRKNAENYIKDISRDIGIRSIYTTPIKASRFVDGFAKGEVSKNDLGLLLILPIGDTSYYVTQVVNGVVVLEPSSEYDKNIPIIIYTDRLTATGNSISTIGYKYQLKSFDSYKTVVGGYRQAIHLKHIE